MFSKLLLLSTLWFQPPTLIQKILPGRTLRDTTKNYIVIHNDGSGSDVTTTRLTLRLRGLSYHYFISKTGKLYQFKDVKYVANHAGLSKYLGLTGWNNFSIGICLQGSESTGYTDAQYQTLNSLIEYLHKRYPDSKDRPVVTHADIAYPRGRKQDPGKNFDFTKIIKDGI